jgi:L-threonylcarbamoyladenylate synthase
MIIDGGVSPGGVESTMVDITGEKPVIVREGAISRAEIECACALFDPSIVVV